MKTATVERAKQNKAPSVIDFYDAAADVKNRISLRGAKTKYFHVQALSNGSYLLEPRVLVPPHTVSAHTLKMLAQSAANYKKGRVSEPIDLSAFIEPLAVVEQRLAVGLPPGEGGVEPFPRAVRKAERDPKMKNQKLA